MALVSCPECEKQVSTETPSCPDCGTPIASKQETKAAETALTTTQGTSKRLKLHSLLSSVIFIIGFLGTFFQLQNNDPGNEGASPIWFLMLVAGIIWFTTTKIRIWWLHR